MIWHCHNMSALLGYPGNCRIVPASYSPRSPFVVRRISPGMAMREVVLGHTAIAMGKLAATYRELGRAADALLREQKESP
jgi:hypothetical protein